MFPQKENSAKALKKWDTGRARPRMGCGWLVGVPSGILMEGHSRWWYNVLNNCSIDRRRRGERRVSNGWADAGAGVQIFSLN